MPSITYVDGMQREVNNLRWLLDNHNLVTSFTVAEGPIRGRGAHLRVFFDPTQTKYSKAPERYDTLFMDKSILHRFLNRPSFQGLPVMWFGEPHYVGDPDYLELDPYA